jgi:hypothetical protein
MSRVLITTLFLSLTIKNGNTNSSLNNRKYLDEDKITNFLYKINEGYRTIYEICENIEIETSSHFNLLGNKNPNCKYNMSYIIDSKTIIIYNIPNDIREFLYRSKTNKCKNLLIECGTLTIIIKLLDLVNSAVKITAENTDYLWINLRIINFKDNYYLYLNSLSNNEIITNITLSKQKANIILETEKNRIKKMLARTWINSITGSIDNFIGTPIKDTGLYLTSTFGDLFSNALEHSIPNIAFEYKIIILLIMVLLIKK